ncbi:hypothetical protein OsJ_18384 [Oryza sativa Japonica Group]|uniref:DDE Tnp4 domain-containing protein n=1 Tax=Oryza sativa subsp. japonica TaxID=39947 RepID=B9FPC9_ORYSJ|nr:hypothetical protein OsJ_18384 [Oryza sativa Japonica Group]
MVVFRETVNNADHFPHPPPCNYYLVDSGYPLREGYMSPYRKTRYHLKQLDTKGPENLHEIFNYQHSCLRNVVERSFGVLKESGQQIGSAHDWLAATAKLDYMVWHELVVVVRGSDVVVEWSWCLFRQLHDQLAASATSTSWPAMLLMPPPPHSLVSDLSTTTSCLTPLLAMAMPRPDLAESRLQGSGVLHAKIDGDYYQAFDMEDWHVCWDGYGFLGKLARDYVTFMILSHWNTMFLNADDAGARTSAERQRPISSSSGEPARQPA